MPAPYQLQTTRPYLTNQTYRENAEALGMNLLRPGHPGRGPALEIGPGFRRRYYLASSTGGIETVLDLDEQGQQIAFPWFPDPQPQSQLALSGEWSGRAARTFARLIHFVTPRSRRTIARVACGGNLNLPWLLHSVGAYGSRSGLTTGSYA